MSRSQTKSRTRNRPQSARGSRDSRAASPRRPRLRLWRLFSPSGKLRRCCPRPNTGQPGVHVGQEFEPGGITADDLPARPAQEDDSKVIENFRELVRQRLGGLGLAVLDARLDGKETRSLVGCPSLGSPGKWVIKRVVQQVKELAREFAMSLGDSEMLRRVERAMASEGETVEKRRTAMAARQAVGA